MKKVSLFILALAVFSTVGAAPPIVLINKVYPGPSPMLLCDTPNQVLTLIEQYDGRDETFRRVVNEINVAAGKTACGTVIAVHYMATEKLQVVHKGSQANDFPDTMFTVVEVMGSVLLAPGGPSADFGVQYTYVMNQAVVDGGVL